MSKLIGRVHHTESFGTVDGPGIRYIVFMQGCLMKCKYCHNRDSWDLHGGKEMTVEDIMHDVRDYIHFIKSSGGGITVSGGEPTLQAEFVTELFKACREEGIHTCLDSNGFMRVHNSAIDDLLDVTDLVLLDLKSMDDEKHIDLTKVSNRYAIQFAEMLAERNIPVWIRDVIVEGYTDTPESVRALGAFIKDMKNIERVELLPYHEMGVHKWYAMGESYPFENIKPPTKERMDLLKSILAEYHPNVIY